MYTQSRAANRIRFEPFHNSAPMLHRAMPAAVFAIALMLNGGAPVSAQNRRIELNDYAKITSVSDPQISPDGKTIVFVISRPNLEQDRSDRGKR